MKTRYVCALIAVKDIKRSRDFYERLLDQKVKFDFGENVIYQNGFAIHVISHFRQMIGNKKITTRSNSYELYFECKQPEEISERLKSEGVTFVHDVLEQPWRQKVLRFYDPDGTLIEVGETMKHLVTRLRREGHSDREITVMTGLPDTIVEKSHPGLKKSTR